MNLTGKELVEQGIITGVIDQENIQQHGVDLNVIKIEQIVGNNYNGIVPVKGKTTLAQRIEVQLYKEKDKEPKGWYLLPGVYDVTLQQGCKVPSDKMLLIRQRSSLLRNGTILHSSIFDAGFSTESIGTVMIVMTPIFIEKGARIAQVYAHNSNVVENLYQGQWQGDQQRVIS
jgi:deoxycytidine triphosphate deaminase